MKFQYTALSKDSNKLTGILEASSMEAAKEQLHKMELSIIGVNEISEEKLETIKNEQREIAIKKDEIKEIKEVTNEIKSYSFLVKDLTGKEVNGTIDAKDDYSAYKRLITEYNFEVLELFPENKENSEIYTNKLIELKAKGKTEGIEIKREVKNKELNEDNQNIDLKIETEITNVIKDTKNILSENEEIFTPTYFRKINETLGELERIRKSNNITHISEVVNEIYKYLRHPDNINNKNEYTEKYKNTMNSMQENKLIRKGIELNNTNPLSQIKGMFIKIGNQIKKLRKGKRERNVFNKTKETNEAKKDVNNDKITISKLFILTWSLLLAKDKLARSEKKNELIVTFNEWKNQKKVSKPKPKPQSEPQHEPQHEPQEEPSSKLDFFFIEMDSFLGWLLFFYIGYFFLINFSLEKGFGLPSEFIIKTLKSSLILNITIFLIFSHFIFRMKNLHFRNNTIGTIFLFLFGYGLYILLISNF